MNTKRRFYGTFVTLICLVLISGCWNRRELNDLAVSVAIGVDKSGKQIMLSNQILNTGAISGKEGGSSSLAPVTLFREKGDGFQEAARRMTTRSTRKIYVGQLQILIFGEKFAKEGVGRALDHISRDHEYRKDFYVVIARGVEAQDILKVLTPLEKTPATKMNASLEVSSKAWGATADVKIDEFTSNIISKGKEAVLSGITLMGDPQTGNDRGNVEKIFSPARLKYMGIAVFKKDKLLGWLNEEESMGYNYTQGKVKSTAVLLTCPNEESHMSVEVLRTKNDTKVIMKNGKPSIKLKIKAEGVVTDVQCPIDLTKPSSILQIEQLTQNKIKASILSVIKTVQTQYKSDIFGFGEEVERSYPKYWEGAKNNWEDIMSTMKVDVQIEMKIKQMFKTSKSFYERMGE
ncbi:Ger(x)C family spore germination protein [Paenibacillus sp. Root444D2]|uniref:Ger(x)C family spore germination protein n=1 Tax=Paenibacillus sp. Root444D2 TaxID=1736538 RepID=UPI0007C6CFE5|nr:Ger(x)C family spore germination protein [Paenibacillus sp. Root444D2]